MVEKGLAEPETVKEPEHPLFGKAIDDLKLREVPSLTEKSTIADALKIFK